MTRLLESGLADRMRVLGGHLDVHSILGAGARVRATIPLRPVG
jgi:hypothetical protein